MIVELFPFDLTTAAPSMLVNTAGLWESLPRLCGNSLATGRLILVADTLEKEQFMDFFHNAATPEAMLPPGVLAYRIDYENYLKRMVQSVRYIRAYLSINTNVDPEGLLGLLGAYGLRAQQLDHEMPRPFTAGQSVWEAIETDRGHYGALVSAADQGQANIHPRVLHNLFAQEFPVYTSLHFYTFPQAEVMRLLNQKSAMALYSAGKTMDSIHEAQVAQSGVQIVSDAISAGEALHTFRLHVLVPGKDRRELEARLEVVRGALPFKMERVYAPGATVTRLFSAEALEETDGTPVTTSGAALLAGSALSYRRRTATNGVMLGIDRNQAPVILDIFDDRNPSYNTVILGQTGSGKTFATLLLMLRHLLMGVRLIIIDPQSNVDLEFLGGEVYRRSMVGTSQAAVNVLDIVYDEIGAQVEMAVAMLRLLGVHGDKPLERALLDEALMALYKPIWGRAEAPAPLISDLYAWMKQRVESARSGVVRDTADSLTISLEAYVSGSRAELFGRPTNMDFGLERAVNVFDVSNLPQQGLGGNLRSALLSILVANINQGIRRRRRKGDRAPILFFVDEMGILMRDSVVANYISSEYKTSRARLVGMIVADQDLHSLLGPRDEKGLHHGVPILANAANTLIFNQKDGERSMIQEHFPGLPSALVDALPALPRGTCLANFADGDLLMVNVVPSPLDRVVLSSRLQDRVLAKSLVKQIQKEVNS
ncbi:MAG TPA: hypothetical protein PLV64_21855 [Anaerolineales bacterium]|nr:hypothetical protein [Anaerolineales bacterium]